MKSLLTGFKDKALLVFGQFMFTKWGLDKYGEIQPISLQSGKKRIDVTVLLIGETSPIEVGVDYRIESIGEQTFLIADQVTFSRQWATLLFEDHCPPELRRREVDSAIASLL